MNEQTTEICYLPISRGRNGGWSLAIAVRNVQGYFETDYPSVETADEADEWAQQCNDDLGLTPGDVSKVILSTLPSVPAWATEEYPVE